MNKKLYFNLVYLITGTFILLATAAIVIMNAIKDSRLVPYLTNLLTKIMK